jgi:hypothetical protein
MAVSGSRSRESVFSTTIIPIQNEKRIIANSRILEELKSHQLF